MPAREAVASMRRLLTSLRPAGHGVAFSRPDLKLDRRDACPLRPEIATSVFGFNWDFHDLIFPRTRNLLIGGRDPVESRAVKIDGGRKNVGGRAKILMRPQISDVLRSGETKFR